jgi:uncharacterized protein GlcG (DUF336 family)
MKSLYSLTFSEAMTLEKCILACAEDEMPDGGPPVPISYAIVDRLGQLLKAGSQDGAMRGTDNIAIAKSRTALWAEKHTVLFGYERQEDGWKALAASGHRADDNRRVVFPDFVSYAGGLVIVRDEEIVGATGISGRKELEDHDLGEVSILDFKNRTRL